MSEEILSSWAKTYNAYRARSAKLVDKIASAENAIDGTPAPYVGINALKQYKEGKRYGASLKGKRYDILNAQAEIRQGQVAQSTEIHKVLKELFPPQSPVMESLKKVLSHEGTCEKTLGIKNLTERALGELSSAQKETKQAVFFETTDIVVGGPGSALLSHMETKESKNGIEGLAATLDKLKKTTPDKRAPEASEAGKPIDAFDLQIDLSLGLVGLDLPNAFFSYENKQKLGHALDAMKSLGPKLVAFDERTGERLKEQRRALAQERERCTCLIFEQLDNSLKNSKNAPILKQAIQELPPEILFSKEAIPKADPSRPSSLVTLNKKEGIKGAFRLAEAEDMSKTAKSTLLFTLGAVALGIGALAANRFVPSSFDHKTYLVAMTWASSALFATAAMITTGISFFKGREKKRKIQPPRQPLPPGRIKPFSP